MGRAGLENVEYFPSKNFTDFFDETTQSHPPFSLFSPWNSRQEERNKKEQTFYIKKN